MTIIVQGLFAGMVATILIDVWAFMLKFFKLPTANWAMVGRWIGHMRHRQFVHDSIGNAAPVAGEKIIGWVTHYVIGLLYGVGYLWLIVEVMEQIPDLLSAVAFSLALLVAPWLIMQPGLGHGFFASRTPRPWLIRTINVSVHIVFGVGLYLGWVISG